MEHRGVDFGHAMTSRTEMLGAMYIQSRLAE